MFDAKCAKPAHPLIVHGRPNDVGFTRLGLSVNRRIGTAVERNRIKRLIREAFRLLQYDLPAGYDIVVVARRPSRDGPTFEIERSKELLLAAATQIDREWQRRRSSSGHHRRRRPRT